MLALSRRWLAVPLAMAAGPLPGVQPAPDCTADTRAVEIPNPVPTYRIEVVDPGLRPTANDSAAVLGPKAIVDAKLTPSMLTKAPWSVPSTI